MIKIEEKHLNSYSFSKLKTFYNCKLYYYMHYYDKSLQEESHGTSEFGSFVHEILEKYAKGELEIYELLPYYKEHYSQNVVSSFSLKMSENFSKDMAQRYYESGENFLENFSGFDFDILDAELQFDLPYSNLFFLNGKIDLIARKDEDIYLIDYKSKGNWKSKSEKEEYSKQLYLYAWAIKQIYGVFPKKMAFYMFRINKWEWFDFSEQKMFEVLNWAKNVVEEIESEFDFSPETDNNGNIVVDFWKRNFCGIRNSCKYHCGEK